MESLPVFQLPFGMSNFSKRVDFALKEFTWPHWRVPKLAIHEAFMKQSSRTFINLYSSKMTVFRLPVEGFVPRYPV